MLLTNQKTINYENLLNKREPPLEFECKSSVRIQLFLTKKQL